MHHANVLAAAIASVLVLTSEPADGQVNPNGWIQSQGWNYLWLDTACRNATDTCRGCGQGGIDSPGHVDVHWVTPHDVRIEDPRPGDVWNDIQIVSPGSAENGPGGSRTGDFTWYSTDRFLETFGVDTSGQDVPDFDAWLAAARLDSDDVYVVATTYVDNPTDAPIPVGLCSASDDSVLIWVNGSLSTSRSECRSTSADCAEISWLRLMPGISKIAAIIHQGLGGFSFRIGLRGPQGNYRDGGPIRFLGNGSEGLSVTAADPETIDITLEPAPAGWIRDGNWATLFPIHNSRGGTPGGVGMLAELAATHHDLAGESPRSSTRWSDAGHSWGSRSGLPDGLWLSSAAARQALARDIGAPWDPTRDVIDFRGKIDTWNATLGTTLSVVDVFGLAVTYVENLTSESMEVGLSTASDDSITVFVNQQLVASVDACPNFGEGCGEPFPAVLVPGVNKIATAVYQGAGDWRFRCGIVLPDGTPYNSIFHSDLLRIIGDGSRELPETPETFAVVGRKLTFAPLSCPSGVLPITIIGNGFTGGDVTVVDRLSGVGLRHLRIEPSDVVTAVGGAVDVDPSGFLRTWLHLGPYSQTGGPTPGDSIRRDYLTDGVETEGTFEFADGATIETDFAIAASTGIRQDGGRNPRSLPTVTLDTDDDDTIDYLDIYGRVVSDIMMYSVIYIEVFEPGLTGVQLAVASDDSIQGKIDGVEVLICRSCVRAFGDAGTIQDRSVRIDLSPGIHQILLKVFQGGGGHGFRARLEKDGVGLTSGFQLVTSSDPMDGLGTDILRWEVALATTADAINAGEVGYTIFHDDDATVEPTGEVFGSVSGVLRPSPSFQLAGTTGPVGPFCDSHAIGGGDAGGSLTDNGDGTLTMEFSGDDISDSGDQFYFAYCEVTGDFDARVHITERVGPPGSRSGVHGIMARYTCDGNSKYSMAATYVAGSNELDTPRHLNRRDHLVDGTTMNRRVLPDQSRAGVNDPQPEWIRLTRVGAFFYSSFSFDGGATWEIAGGDTHVDAPETVLLGIAGTSHDGRDRASITVADWSVDLPGPAPIGALEDADPIVLDFEGVDLAMLGAEVVVGGPVGLPFVPEVVDGRLRITDEAVGGSATAVWFDGDDRAERLLGGFAFEFDAHVYGAAGRPGDGFAVVFLDGTFADAAGKVGGAGGAAGYDQGDADRIPVDPNRRRGFAVEVDHRDGGLDSNDPPQSPTNYHLGLDVNDCDQSMQTSYENGYTGENGAADGLPDLYEVESGIHVRGTYAPDRNDDRALVRVWLSAAGWPEVPVLEAYVPEFETGVVFGVTGGTSRAASTQEIDDVSIVPICVETEDSVLLAGPASIPVDSSGVISASFTGADGAVSHDWSGNVTDEGDGTATLACDRVGRVVVRVRAGDGVCRDEAEDTLAVACVAAGSGQRPGDFNQDGRFDISDAVSLLGHLFLGGAGPACGDRTVQHAANLLLLDANADGRVDISDSIHELGYLFLGGPAPAGGTDCVRIVDCPGVCAP